MKLISLFVILVALLCMASGALAGLRGSRSLATSAPIMERMDAFILDDDADLDADDMIDNMGRRLGKKKRVPLSVDDPRWTAPRADGRCGPKYGFAGCDPASEAPCCNYHRKTAKCGSSRRFCNSVGRRAWGVDFRLAMETVTAPPTAMQTPKPTPEIVVETTPPPTPAPTPKPTPFSGLRPLDRIEAENRAKFAKGSKIKLSAKKPTGLGQAKACCATPDILATVAWSEWDEPALAPRRARGRRAV